MVFQWSVQSSMASMSWSTDLNAARRRRRLVIWRNQSSTRLSQLLEVGVKCRWIRRWRASQARMLGCFWVSGFLSSGSLHGSDRDDRSPYGEGCSSAGLSPRLPYVRLLG